MFLMAKRQRIYKNLKAVKTLFLVGMVLFQNQAISLTCNDLVTHIVDLSESHYLYSDEKFYKETPVVEDDKLISFIHRILDRAADVWIHNQNSSLRSQLTVQEEKQAREAFAAMKDRKCEATLVLRAIKLNALKRFEKNLKVAIAAVSAVKSDNSLPYYFIKQKKYTSANDEDQLQHEATLYLNSLFADNSKEKLSPVEKIKRTSQEVARAIKDIEIKGPTAVFEDVLDSYAAALDPHTVHLNTYEYREFLEEISDDVKSIGIRVEHTEYYPIIKTVLRDAEDELADIKPEDEIVGFSDDGINYENTHSLSSQEFEDKMRGAPDTIAYLKLRRKNVDALIIAKRTRKTYEERNPQAIMVNSYEVMDSSQHKRKIGVIRFVVFHENIARDVKAAIRRLSEQQVEAIVIDVRSNGGGTLGGVADIVDALIAEGSAVQVKQANKPAKQLYRSANSRNQGFLMLNVEPEIHYSGPLVVAINENSASASEILAGALKDYKRALVVGSAQSFGKGSVQSIAVGAEDSLYNKLHGITPNGIVGALKFTSATFFLASGKSTQFNGVPADIVIPTPRNDLAIRSEHGERGLPLALQVEDISSVLDMEAAMGTKGWKIPSEAQLQTLKRFSEERLVKDKDAQLIAEYNSKVEALIQKESMTVGEYEELTSWHQKHLSQQSVDLIQDNRSTTDLLKYNPQTNLAEREILALTADYVSVLGTSDTHVVSEAKP